MRTIYIPAASIVLASMGENAKEMEPIMSAFAERVLSDKIAKRMLGRAPKSPVSMEPRAITNLIHTGAIVPGNLLVRIARSSTTRARTLSVSTAALARISETLQLSAFVLLDSREALANTKPHVSTVTRAKMRESACQRKARNMSANALQFTKENIVKTEYVSVCMIPLTSFLLWMAVDLCTLGTHPLRSNATILEGYTVSKFMDNDPRKNPQKIRIVKEL